MRYKDWEQMMQSEDGEFVYLSDEAKKNQYNSFLRRSVAAEDYSISLKEERDHWKYESDKWYGRHLSSKQEIERLRKTILEMVEFPYTHEVLKIMANEALEGML